MGMRMGIRDVCTYVIWSRVLQHTMKDSARPDKTNALGNIPRDWRQGSTKLCTKSHGTALVRGRWWFSDEAL